MRLDKTKSLLVILGLGLAVLDGWTAWDLFRFLRGGKGRESGFQRLAKDLKDRSVKALTGTGREARRAAYWDYSDLASWEIFWKANFTGKEPPKPVPKAASKPASKPAPKSHGPLSDDVELLSLFVFPGEEGSGPDAYVILRYKKPVSSAAAMDRGVPAGNAAAQALSIHMVHQGERLRPPFDAWKLEKILPDGSGAVFRWNGTDREVLRIKQIAATLEAREESDLPRTYGEEGAASRPGKGAGKGRASKGRGASGSAPAGRRWRPVKKITQVAPGDWLLPEKDVRDFGRNPDQWLNSVRLGAHLLPPRARKRHGGQRTGLAIGKVSGKARELGLEEGMILISLNGHPVRTKAEAIRVGKMLYKQGVRVFQATVLQYGRERTLIYRLPDGK